MSFDADNGTHAIIDQSPLMDYYTLHTHKLNYHMYLLVILFYCKILNPSPGT
jgi:hypothetical protein